MGAYAGSLYGARSKTRKADEAEATTEHSVEQSGGLRIAVRIDESDTEHRAVEVLQRFGAQDLGRAEGEWHNGSWVDFDPRVSPKPLQA